MCRSLAAASARPAAGALHCPSLPPVAAHARSLLPAAARSSGGASSSGRGFASDGREGKAYGDESDRRGIRDDSNADFEPRRGGSSYGVEVSHNNVDRGFKQAPQ